MIRRMRTWLRSAGAAAYVNAFGSVLFAIWMMVWGSSQLQSKEQA